MKLGETFRFELACQARRVPTWLYAAVLLGLTWRMATEAFIGNARADGYFFNAPFVVATVMLFGSLMALLPAAALAGDAAARDVATRMHPLVYTAPVGKSAYLGGRFLAAFALGALVLLAVPAGLLLATFAPGPEPELAGPFRPSAWLGAYVFVALPNLFVATAIPFSLAALGRRSMAGYLGAVLLFFASILCWLFLAGKLGRWELAKLLDPLGLTAMAELSRTWTAAEKNTRLVWLEGSLVTSRLAWLGVALGALALTWMRFRFAHHAVGGRRSRGAGADAPLPDADPIAVPRVPRAFGAATRARQTGAVAWESFRVIVTSWGGLGLAFLTVALVLSGPAWTAHMGVPLHPTTGLITPFLGDLDEAVWMIIPLLTAFYAGELVWRERDGGLGEIADAAPLPDWVPLTGKLLGLGLVLVTLQALMMAGAMIVQARLGHYDFEIGLYVRILFGLQLADYLLFALLAVVVHVLVDHKYVGHLVVVMAYALMAFGPTLGMEQNLLVYGSDPGWSHSDMRGFAPFIGPWLWLKLYWAAWALLLALAARLLWVRGREAGAGGRLRVARRRLTRSLAGAAAAAAGLILGLGGFVFYNTYVLNGHQTAAEGLERRAEYERRYGRYAGVAQPRLAGTRLHVELYPERREVEIRGVYRLVNEGTAPIDTVHVATDAEVRTGAVTFDRPSARVLADDALGHRVYALETPLRPGEGLEMRFTVRFAPRGFPNRGIDASVALGGTYFVARDWLPAIGYQAARELGEAGDRRVHGLAPRPAFRSPHDTAALREVPEPRIAFEAVVGTAEDEIALAPGTLRRTWARGGRRYFHYATDAPIKNDYAFFSAAYAVHDSRWIPPSGQPVAIQIFHHPGHAWNVERMARSVTAALDYHAARFGPYPHRQLRLVEHPGTSVALHAYPINISYPERFALFNPESDPRGVDFPFAIVAHEVAHQWWGNQLTPAWVEGGALLSESLAWYSALGAVEAHYGRDHLRRLLGLMREAYLTPHTRAAVPLLRADGWLLPYRKGPFAMYALREYVGEARVDAALRRLIGTHGAGAPPLPTSLDLYRELRAATPDSLRPLLADLFERNTYWELAAERVAAEPMGGGAWRVTLDVRARKVVVDSTGAETEVPMDDLVEVGVYADAKKGDPGEPLYLRLHRVRSGAQRITVTVPREPARAGIDPRSLLIDDEAGDNLAGAEIARATPLPRHAREGRRLANGRDAARLPAPSFDRRR